MTEPAVQSTTPSFDRDAVLRQAKASPEIAGQHDKDRWLALYTEDAVLEDPVGTPASHRGRRLGRFGDEVGRFYEAFIAPSSIDMVTRQDIVSDMHVFRAVDIHTMNLKTGLKMRVPANLLYEVVARDGALQIRRMQAHWELNRMSRQIMNQGLLGVRTIAVMNWSMLRAFGPKWLMGYFQAAQAGVGRKGRELVESLQSEVARGEGSSFADDARVELPGGITAPPSEFMRGCESLACRDLLVSGRTVSGLATVQWGGRTHEAGFVAELDPQAERVRRLRWFWER